MAERECVILSAGGSGYDLSNVYRPKRWGLQVVLRVFDSMAMGDQEQRWWLCILALQTCYRQATD